MTPTNAKVTRAYGQYVDTMSETAAHLGVHYASRRRRHESAVSDCKT